MDTLFRIHTKSDENGKSHTILVSPFVFGRLEAERRCQSLNDLCKTGRFYHEPVPDSNYKPSEVWEPTMTLFEVKQHLGMIPKEEEKKWLI